MNSRNDHLSIYGLYLFNTDLFDEMVVPTGMEKDTLVENLVLDCSELELLYPSGDFMKTALKLWSKNNISVWQHMYDALTMEYNPIWNKDGNIEEKREIKGSGNTKTFGKDENQVSAYNETGYHPESQTTANNEANTLNTSEETYSRREYGNIGVTTTQAMISEELRLRKNNNMNTIIINDFKRRFCLLVY